MLWPEPWYPLLKLGLSTLEGTVQQQGVPSDATAILSASVVHPVRDYRA